MVVEGPADVKAPLEGLEQETGTAHASTSGTIQINAPDRRRRVAMWCRVHLTVPNVQAAGRLLPTERSNRRNRLPRGRVGVADHCRRDDTLCWSIDDEGA